MFAIYAMPFIMFMAGQSQQTRDIETRLVYRWPDVYNTGSTLF